MDGINLDPEVFDVEVGLRLDGGEDSEVVVTNLTGGEGGEELEPRVLSLSARLDEPWID